MNADSVFTPRGGTACGVISVALGMVGSIRRNNNDDGVSRRGRM